MHGRHRVETTLLTLTITLAASGAVSAGASASQRVTYEVKAIDQIALTGAPPALTIDTATAGAAPAAVTADGGSYAITTNGSDRKITAALATAMPPGVTLSMVMDAPATGTSVGWQALGPTPTEMVTGIARVAETGLAVRYRLTATVDAGILSARTETVTVTLADGS
jgi:hypothetical protein